MKRTDLVEQIDVIATELQLIAEQMEMVFAGRTEMFLIASVLDYSIQLTEISSKLC